MKPKGPRVWPEPARLLAAIVCCALSVPPALAQDAMGGPQDTFKNTYEARALVEAVSEVTLSSEIPGRIVELPRREGEAFNMGDTLVRFDCRNHEARLKVAKADHAIAVLTRENALERAKLGSIGTLQVGIAKAEVEKAQGEVDAAAFRVDRCHIRAPFDGAVVERVVRAHETVAVGEPLIRVLNNSDLQVKIVVPSTWLSWLGVGTAFTIDIDETGKTHSGQVTRLGALVDAVGQSIPAYGVLESGADQLIAGMSGTVRFNAPPADAE